MNSRSHLTGGGGHQDDVDVSTLTTPSETLYVGGPSSQFRRSLGEDGTSSRQSGNNTSQSHNNSIQPRSSLTSKLKKSTSQLNLFKLRFDDLPLMGREAPLAALELACNNRTTTSRRGLVLIKGVSGVGKTSLMQQLILNESHRHKKKHNKMAALGKCELQQVDEPYACVQDALELLCYKILSLPTRRSQSQLSDDSIMSSIGTGTSSSASGESPTKHNLKKNQVTLEDVKDRLKMELDESEWKLLVEAVPGLEKIMVQVEGQRNDDHDHDHDKIETTTATTTGRNGAAFKESSDRLKFIYRHFIRVVSSVCPLLLVLDDCQWADNSSLEWIKYILTDTDTGTNTKTISSKIQQQDEADQGEEIESTSKGGPTSEVTTMMDADTRMQEDTTKNKPDKGAVTTPTKTNHEIQNTAASNHDGSSSSLVIVASFRSDEVEQDHPLAKMIAELQAQAASLTSPSLEEEGTGGTTASDSPNSTSSSFFLEEITLDNLTVENISDMLVELLNREPDETMEFARVLHQKTMGNAFFVVQFLLRIKDDQQLTFRLGQMKWTWDLEAIKARYSSTDNVADLMKEKMQISSNARTVLPVASCLGNTFSPELLQKIMDGLYVRRENSNSSSDTKDGQTQDPDDNSNNIEGIEVTPYLEQCVADGFLDATHDGRFRFIHDKVQETALEFLDPEIKIAVGDIFLQEFLKDKGQFGETIYSAVNLVNLQLDGLSNEDEKMIGIAEMNAMAGKKAMDNAAFEPAARYLTKAISVLPHDHWIRNRDLTDLSLGIYILAGAAEFNTGHRDKVKTYTEHLLHQTNVPLLDKIDLCHTLMDAYEVGLDSATNLEFGLKILKGFNCRFPKSGLGITVSTIASLMKAKMQLPKKLAAQVLESKPIVNDKTTMALMKTLDKLSNAAFNTKPDLLPLVILEMAKYTDSFGLNPYAAVSYSFLGLLFAGVLDDFQTAKVCAEAGVAIMRKCDYPVVNSRCILLAYNYALHWSMPIKNCMRPLLEGYKTGMQMGTLDGAFFCICFYLEFSFWTAERLSLLHADITTYITQMEDYDAQKPIVVLILTRHMIDRLRGLADESREAEYEVMCQDEAPLECGLRRTQMYVACILGEHQKTADLALVWQAKVCKIVPGQANTLEVTFVSALSCMAVSRQSLKSKKKYLKHAKMCQKKIKSWVSKGCPNCVAHEALLEAESLALNKDKGMALRSYESAVLLAGRRGLTHIQALANERFAIYLEEVGQIQDAQYRFKEATLLYEEWGATHKVDQLRQNNNGASEVLAFE